MEVGCRDFHDFQGLPGADWADLHISPFLASHSRSPRRGRHIVATGVSPWSADRHGPNPRRGWHIAPGREPAATLTLRAQQGNAFSPISRHRRAGAFLGICRRPGGGSVPRSYPPRVCTRGYYMPPPAEAPEVPSRVPVPCPETCLKRVVLGALSKARGRPAGRRRGHRQRGPRHRVAGHAPAA